MRLSLLAAACAAAGMAQASFGQAVLNNDGSLTLQVTIRDFRGVHATGANPLGLSVQPNFDQFDFGNPATLPPQYLPFVPVFNLNGQDQSNTVEPGIVKSTLGVDNKPVYQGGTNPALYKTTTNASDFNEWFNDTPGVNASMTSSLTLKSLGNGSFGFRSDRTVDPGTGIGDDGVSDGGFFPIDGKLDGNDGVDNNGVSHNFSFTTELHDTITYKAGSSQVFNFSGDDDLFIFVNKSLVLDLGGVHNEQSGTVNLDSLASGLGLVDGGKYAVDVFYAERNTFNSDLQFDTTFFADVAGPPPVNPPPVNPPPVTPPAVPLPAAAWSALLVLAGLGGASRLRKTKLA